MITTVLVGFLLIVLLAGVVEIMDSRQASTWRAVAAERRRTWEARRAMTAMDRDRRPGALVPRRFGGPPAVQP